MPRSTDYLSSLFVHGFTLAIIGSVAKPTNQRVQYQPASYFEPYLPSRGFNQTPSKPPSNRFCKSWSPNTNQCFQLKSANGNDTESKLTRPAIQRYN